MSQIKISNFCDFSTTSISGGANCPELPTANTFAKLLQRNSTGKEQAYYAALKLVAAIDERLTRQTEHYRTNDGALLTTLDEVVTAILQDNCRLPGGGE